MVPLCPRSPQFCGVLWKELDGLLIPLLRPALEESLEDPTACYLTDSGLSLFISALLPLA